MVTTYQCRNISWSVKAFVDIKLNGLCNLDLCFTRSNDVKVHLFPPKVNLNGTIQNGDVQQICYEYNLSTSEINSTLRISYSFTNGDDTKEVNFRTFEIYENGAKWIEKPFFPFGFWIDHSYLSHVVLKKGRYMKGDESFKLHIVLEDCLARYKRYGNSKRLKTMFLYHNEAVPYSSTGLCHIEDDKLYNVIHKLPENDIKPKFDSSLFLDLGLAKYTEQSHGSLVVEIPCEYNVAQSSGKESYTFFKPELNNYKKAFGVKQWMPGMRTGNININHGKRNSFTLMSQRLSKGTYCMLDIRALNTSQIPQFTLTAGHIVNLTQSYDSLLIAGVTEDGALFKRTWTMCFIKEIYCFKEKGDHVEKIFRITYYVWDSDFQNVNFVLRAQISNCTH